MSDLSKRIPVREQDGKVRATNYEEVSFGYTSDEAFSEANRCLGCKNPKCVEGCPVNINIPAFIGELKKHNVKKAYEIISDSSALPAFAEGSARRKNSAKATVCVGYAAMP